MLDLLKNNYLASRSRGNAPALAFENAKRNTESGITLYAKHGKGYGNRRHEGAVWIEDPAETGLRFVAYADEISQWINHTGWFTVDDGHNDENMRGAVWQMSSVNGCPRFLAGYVNPHNGARAARILVDTVYTSKSVKVDEYTEPKDTESALEAARAADGFAETSAESEREYNRAWQAGSQYAETSRERTQAYEESRAAVLSIRRLLAELKHTGSHGPQHVQIAGEALQHRYAKVMLCRETATRLSAQMRKLENGDHGLYFFYKGNANLVAAFNDGAGT